MVVSVQIAPPDFDRMFGALADHTRRDIVRRAIAADEGIVELASHYSMCFAAVQKHIAILERAGLVTKERVGPAVVTRYRVQLDNAAQRVSTDDSGSCGGQRHPTQRSSGGHTPDRAALGRRWPGAWATTARRATRSAHTDVWVRTPSYAVCRPGLPAAWA